MNMNRGLVLSLCAAVALGAMASVSVADTQLSLNLRYTQPADPSQGGTFRLVGITDDPDGLVGVSAYLENIDMGGITAPAGVNANINGGVVPVADFGGVINVVYGQDLSQAVQTGVGTPGMAAPPRLASDPLNNAAWNNASVLVSGTFGATRPVFSSSGANSTDANEYDPGSNVGVAPGSLTTTVRGDSLNSLGLESPAGAGLVAGDVNRDGVVNVSGDALTLVGFIGTGTTWDQGDINGDGVVNVSGDALTLVGNIGVGQIPPAIGGVPEPSTIGLAGLAFAGFGLAMRRRKR
jgi:hypothetical protein